MPIIDETGNSIIAVKLTVDLHQSIINTNRNIKGRCAAEHFERLLHLLHCTILLTQRRLLHCTIILFQ